MLRSRIVVPLLTVMILGTALCSWGAIGISVSFGPPVLPVYTQPPCPAVGYIFVPGYWAWSPALNDYYWVPGTWVPAPQPGYLWTPGWWGFSAGFYRWNPGYWGPTVGFYGGINYGFGYPGSGYYGGYWQGRDFYYNRAVNNVNITNVHVYNKTVVNNVTVNRVAYNGGPGGVQAHPTQAQVTAEHQRHVAETSAQVQHQQAAAKDPAQFVAHNQGRPAVVATPKPGALTASNAVHATLPKVNRPAQTAHANNPKPAAHNQPARAPESAAGPAPQKQQARAENIPRPPQSNKVPHPPEHNQQARTPENAAHPNTTAHKAAPAPHVNEQPRPSTEAHNRAVPQPPGHNVPPGYQHRGKQSAGASGA